MSFSGMLAVVLDIGCNMYSELAALFDNEPTAAIGDADLNCLISKFETNVGEPQSRTC